MANTGKTGADAIYHFVRLACGTLKRYRTKFEAVVIAAVAANAITADQATLITGFIGTVDALCVAMKLLAAYSGTS